MENPIENINELMTALTKLPKEEFDNAVFAVGAVILNTIKEEHGKKFLIGFCEGAINDSGEVVALMHQSKLN